MKQLSSFKCFYWICEVDETQETVRGQAHQICIYGWKYGLGIHSFRLTWSCLIIEFLATLSTFLESSNYRTVITYAFTFRTTNVFCCFYGIIVQIEFVKHKFPNEAILHCSTYAWHGTLHFWGFFTASSTRPRRIQWASSVTHSQRLS